MGPLLFIGLSISIYRQIQRQTDVHQSWMAIRAAITGEQSWKFFVVMLLMFVNWGLEARKWQVLVSSIQQVSFLRAYRAIFSGQAIAFNTINRMGESAVSRAQAKSGALNNRLDMIISNLAESSTNIQASRSRITDTDYAVETTNLAKQQIISQAATAMLAQANQQGQSVLSLLK